jgi:hypothetical protein
VGLTNKNGGLMWFNMVLYGLTILMWVKQCHDPILAIYSSFMGLIEHYSGYFIPTDVGKTMSSTTHYKHTTYKNDD